MPQGIEVTIIIFLGFIFLIGLLSALFPQKLWKVLEGWKATKEPSAAYFFMQRIAGIVVMIIVIALFLFPNIMSRQ